MEMNEFNGEILLDDKKFSSNFDDILNPSQPKISTKTKSSKPKISKKKKRKWSKAKLIENPHDIPQIPQSKKPRKIYKKLSPKKKLQKLPINFRRTAYAQFQTKNVPSRFPSIHENPNLEPTNFNDRKMRKTNSLLPKVFQAPAKPPLEIFSS